MRKVFLITGFNNWGKTRIIFDAFGVGAFRHDRVHEFQNLGCEFLVIPYSNDDLRLRGYCEQYYDRVDELKQEKISPKYIISAFCPTREKEARIKGGPKTSDSLDIIRELYGRDEVHMLLLKYKWCNHAELRQREIERFYSVLPNVTVSTLTQRTYPTRLAALSSTIHAQLP